MSRCAAWSGMQCCTWCQLVSGFRIVESSPGVYASKRVHYRTAQACRTNSYLWFCVGRVQISVLLGRVALALLYCCAKQYCSAVEFYHPMLPSGFDPQGTRCAPNHCAGSAACQSASMMSQICTISAISILQLCCHGELVRPKLQRRTHCTNSAPHTRLRVRPLALAV